MGVYITKINKIGEKEEKSDKKPDYKDIEKKEQEYYWKYHKEETNLQIINNKEIDRHPDPGIFVDISNLDSFLRRPEKQRIGNA
ncbi:MAG: hypothetical protein QXP35_00930 [Candidatus Micrarchaeaceae archaeon]